MNIHQAFPSNYLKSSDLEGKPALMKMERVEIETLGQGRDAEQKPVLYFKSSSAGLDLNKGLVLNKTNTATISDLYGHETDDWNGKDIVIFETDVEFQGKRTPAIRIRAPKKSAEAAKPKPEPTRELVDDEIPF